jgi:hypothetical protein
LTALGETPWRVMAGAKIKWKHGSGKADIK